MNQALEYEPEPGDLGRFRRVVDAMPHLAWLNDPAGRIEFVNEPWLAYTGVTLEMLQIGVSGVVHPDERESTIKAWSTAVKEGRPYEIEYRLRRKADDSYRWFIARALPIRDGAGAILGWIGTATDIDDQRRARESLEFVLEAEASFSGTLDVATIGRTFAAVAIKGFADWCFVQLVNPPDSLTTIAAAHRDPRRLDEVERFIARSRTRSREALLARLRGGSILAPTVTDEQLRAEARDEEHLAILLGLKMHSVMLVPMRAADGSLLGAVTLISAESLRTFSPSDLAVAERIAGRASVAIETAQHFEHQQRLAERLQLLETATRHVFDDRPVDVAEMARRMARAAVPTLADRVTIYFREAPQSLRLIAVHDVDEAMIERTYALRDVYPIAPGSALGTAIESNRPVLLAEFDESVLRDFATDESELERMRSIGHRSVLMVPLRGPNEPIGAIVLSMCRDSARRFCAEDIPVAEELAARTAFALDLVIRHERDHRISQTFQRAALPTELPRVAGIALSAWYAAGGHDAQVGGDWYDAFRLPDGRLVISIGDVAGSGLDAAVIMGSIRQSIRTAAIINPEPRLVLDAVDRVVRALGERFVTAFVGIVDPLFGEVRYASAGHCAALLRFPDGQIDELTTGGLPLGLRNLAGDATKSRALVPGSQLVLYTDGLSELDRDVIAGERLIRSVLAAGAASARGLFARVMGERQARDDVAIMVMTFERSPLEGTEPHGLAVWEFSTADARAGTDVRRALRGYLAEHRLADDELEAAELVAGELIGNAVRHAPGTVKIIADASAAQPVVHVIDQGPGFELNPRLPTDVMAERGRGLFIVNTLADELSICRRTDVAGSHARVVLRALARV